MQVCNAGAGSNSSRWGGVRDRMMARKTTMMRRTLTSALKDLNNTSLAVITDETPYRPSSDRQKGGYSSSANHSNHSLSGSQSGSGSGSGESTNHNSNNGEHNPGTTNQRERDYPESETGIRRYDRKKSPPTMVSLGRASTFAGIHHEPKANQQHA